MVRAYVVAVGLLSVSCSGVEPLEPVGSTAGSVSADPGSSSLATSSETDTTASSSATADVTGDATTEQPPATSVADDDSGGRGSEGACPVGSESCPCSPEDACDKGLQCLSGFCVDTGARCPIGAEGCPCTAGGACDLGLQCASMICVDPG